MKCEYDILIWSLLSIIIFIIICLLSSWIIYYIKLNDFLNAYTENFKIECDNIKNLVYRETVYIPYENGVYEKTLAVALQDISYNTTRAECPNILPIPNPPTFTDQLRVEGLTDNKLIMYGYIFWNKKTKKVVFSFAGTVLLEQLRADLNIKQIPPTLLNGYENGILVQEGFYNIYISIREILWTWWNNNKTWVKTFYITGHSLGGALSTICAFDFADVFNIEKSKARNSITGSKRIKNLPIHYSFATPRSGNVLYAQVFNKRLETTLRINNTEDIIPQLPPAKTLDYIYQQTNGSISFTKSLNSLLENHTTAYYEFLPICSNNASCIFTNNNPLDVVHCS